MTQTSVLHMQLNAAQLLDVRKKIVETEVDLQKVRGAARLSKLTELRHLKNLVRPAAKKAVVLAHETYRERLASLDPELLDSLHARKELREARRQRLANIESSPFHREVNVIELRQEKNEEQKQ